MKCICPKKQSCAFREVEEKKDTETASAFSMQLTVAVWSVGGTECVRQYQPLVCDNNTLEWIFLLFCFSLWMFIYFFCCCCCCCCFSSYLSTVLVMSCLSHKTMQHTILFYRSIQIILLPQKDNKKAFSFDSLSTLYIYIFIYFPFFPSAGHDGISLWHRRWSDPNRQWLPLWSGQQRLQRQQQQSSQDCCSTGSRDEQYQWL